MAYMARNTEPRRDIRAWMKDAKSILMCGFSYGEPGAPHSPKEGHGRVARYAAREDYHQILRDRMSEVGAWLSASVPGASAVAFCDMSPILERSYAAAAGLGWQGKNTMLLSADIGSYFLIAGLAMNIDLPADSASPDHCGSCTKCLDACPTDAFPRARVLDASKCISYFTIESKGAIPEPFRERVGDWVFGCDICQEVCPWNATPVFGDAALWGQQNRLHTEPAASLRLNPSQWRSRTRRTALRRVRDRHWRRTLELILGSRLDGMA